MPVGCRSMLRTEFAQPNPPKRKGSHGKMLLSLILQAIGLQILPRRDLLDTPTQFRLQLLGTRNLHRTMLFNALNLRNLSPRHSPHGIRDNKNNSNNHSAPTSKVQPKPTSTRTLRSFCKWTSRCTNLGVDIDATPANLPQYRAVREPDTARRDGGLDLYERDRRARQGYKLAHRQFAC